MTSTEPSTSKRRCLLRKHIRRSRRWRWRPEVAVLAVPHSPRRRRGVLWSKSRRTAISWPFDPADVWSVNVTNRPLSKVVFFWRTRCWKRRKRSTGHPTKKEAMPDEDAVQEEWIGEAAAAGEMALAVNAVPACGAAVEKRRALEQIAPALRPPHLRVCFGVGLKTLRSVIVANHTGPRARCEKKCAEGGLRCISETYLSRITECPHRPCRTRLRLWRCLVPAAGPLDLRQQGRGGHHFHRLTFPATSMRRSRSRASLNRAILGPAHGGTSLK